MELRKLLYRSRWSLPGWAVAVVVLACVVPGLPQTPDPPDLGKESRWPSRSQQPGLPWENQYGNWDNNVIIQEATYFIVASRMVRPGQIYKIAVSVLQTRHPLTVRAAIQRNGVELSADHQQVKEGVPETLILRVPPTTVGGNYKLRVEGLYDSLFGGSAFVNETKLTFSQRSMTIFIQTDKPVYMQGQTVRFRAIPINTELKAFQGPVDVYMLDPNRHIMRRWLSRQSNLGSVSLNYQLSDQPVFGNWTIQVVAQNQVEEYSFLVEEYYQTRFEVNVTMPAFFFIADRYLSGTVMANYTSGAPVQGNLTLKATIRPIRGQGYRHADAPREDVVRYFNFDESFPFWFPAPSYSSRVVPHLKYFYGVYNFRYPLSELEQYVPSLDGMEVVVTAIVGDRFLDEVIHGHSIARVFNSSVKVQFMGGTPQVFKPAMPFTCYISVSYQDGSPLEKRKLDMSRMEIVADVGMRTGGRRNIEPQTLKMSAEHDGIWELKVDLRTQLGLEENKRAVEMLKDVDSMRIQASFKDVFAERSHAELLLLSHYSPSSHHIKVHTSTRNAKVGEYVILHVQSNFFMETFNYIVMSKGIVLLAGQENMQNTIRYHIAKLLELNEIKTVRAKDTRPSNDAGLNIVKYNGKEYHAVLFDSGDFPEMEITREKLTDYDRRVSQYRNLSYTSQGVQTESDTEEIGAVITDPAVSEQDSFIELRSAFQTLTEEPQESFGNVGLVTETRDKEFPEVHNEMNVVTYNTQPSTSRSSIKRFFPFESLTGGCSKEQHEQDIQGPDYASPAHNPIEVIGVTPDIDAQPPLTFTGTDHEDVKQSIEPRVKKHCIFCKKDIGNLPRHLTDKHGDEDRVKEFKDLPPKDRTRLTLLKKLRMEGYNLAKEEGFVVRKGGKHPSVPCPQCGIGYSKLGLFKHYKTCSGKDTPRNIVQHAQMAEQVKQLTNPEVNIPEVLKVHILPKLKAEEKLLKAITLDQRIIDYGNDLCLRFGDEVNKQGNLIRQKLRTLAQIKILMAEADEEIISVEDVFQQRKWNTFINAVVEFSKLKDPDLKKKSPTQVRHVGLLFSGLARDIHSSYSPEDEAGVQKRNRIQGWIDMYNRKYQSTIGWQANKLTVKKKYRMKKRMPLASDVLKLNRHIKNKLISSISILKQGYDQLAWEEANNSAMLSLLLFNRKRKGELETITIEDFRSKSVVEENSEIFQGMTQTEKMISSRYFHLVIRGKFVRPVPLLISKEIAGYIDLLLKYREKAGIQEDNPCLFAKPSGSCFDVSIALRDAAYDCDAEAPADLTSTGLRKHIATVSQALELTDSDLQHLCGFLGHTAKTHLEYYRLPSDVTHTARLSKVLESFNKGDIHKYRGKTIDDIEVDDEIMYDDEDPDEPTQLTREDVRIEQQQTPKKKTTTDMPKPSQRTPLRGQLTPTMTPPKTKRRIKWSTPEKRAMKKAFSKHIASGSLPSFLDCQELRRQEAVLVGRKPTTMKAWVSNQIRKLKESGDYN